MTVQQSDATITSFEDGLAEPSRHSHANTARCWKVLV